VIATQCMFLCDNEENFAELVAKLENYDSFNKPTECVDW